MTTVVVGGGIIGLASAYELVRAGEEVVVVDAGEIGQGASHGNAAKIALGESGPVPAPGVILQAMRWMLNPASPLSVKPVPSPSYVKFLLTMARYCNEKDFRAGLDFNLRLAEDANDLLDGYRADGLDFEMHERGVLLAFENRESMEAEHRFQDIYRRHGHEATVLEGDAVREAEPALSDRIRYGLSFPADRQLDPDTLTRALADAVVARGGKVLDHTAVEDFGVTGGKVTAVALDNGDRILCDTLVLAAGVAVRPLAKKLGVDIPVHPGKGYSIDYSPAPVQLRTSLTLEDAHCAVTPLNGFLRFAGTMEFGSYRSNVNRTRVEAIRRAARENIRGWADRDAEVRAAERTPWAGMRPMTPDGLPTIGRLQPVPNVVVAGGHGMLGLTFGPATGRHVADLVTGQTPRLSVADRALIDPNRF